MGKTKLKSVSFENEEVKKTKAKNSPLPIVRNKFGAIPVHNLLVLVGMFKFGLLEDIAPVLVKGLLTLIVLNFSISLLKRKSFLLSISSLLVGILLGFPLTIILILFGAPINVFTLLLGLHLSIIAISPVLLFFKFDFSSINKIFLQEKIYRSIFSNPILSSSFIAFAGTWLGVIPIPLDWDRPWQQWPVTLLVGAYTGSFLGGVLSLVTNA